MPVWLGEAFRGRRLRRVQLAELVRTRPRPARKARGLVVTYGRDGDLVQVVEALRQEPLYGAGSNGAPAAGTAWVIALPAEHRCEARLRSHGVWVAIVGRGRAAPLCAAAARALRELG
jgi:hypothetical protein